MARSLFLIVVALTYPFALLLFVPALASVSLALLARAAPPGPVAALSFPLRPPAGRSPPLFA